MNIDALRNKRSLLNVVQYQSYWIKINMLSRTGVSVVPGTTCYIWGRKTTDQKGQLLLLIFLSICSSAFDVLPAYLSFFCSLLKLSLSKYATSPASLATTDFIRRNQQPCASPIISCDLGCTK